MRGRRWHVASEKSPALEGLEARWALRRALRAIRIGVAGPPFVASPWFYTVLVLRQFEAGQLSPRPGAGLSELLWFYASLGIDSLIGRTGVHVVFGSLVVLAAAIGVWGCAERRDLDRRGVTARARASWLRSAAARRSASDGLAGEPPAPGRGAPALLRAAGLAIRLLPLLAVAATACFAWLALR